jgi:predicted O-methyltransferase YrrM
VNPNQTVDIALSIDGWMTKKEIDWLISTADSIGNGSVVVEIGCYKGRSSIAIGLSLAVGSVLYCCIDTWRGYPYDLDDLDKDSYWVFLNNLLQFGFARKIVPIKQPSARVATLFPSSSIDWIFIDGSHIYEHVSQDISLWLPKIRRGGMISGHDYVTECPGVVKAVDNVFPQRTITDKIWWVEV